MTSNLQNEKKDASISKKVKERYDELPVDERSRKNVGKQEENIKHAF